MIKTPGISNEKIRSSVGKSEFYREVWYYQIRKSFFFLHKTDWSTSNTLKLSETCHRRSWMMFQKRERLMMLRDIYSNNSKSSKAATYKWMQNNTLKRLERPIKGNKGFMEVSKGLAIHKYSQTYFLVSKDQWSRCGLGTNCISYRAIFRFSEKCYIRFRDYIILRHITKKKLWKLIYFGPKYVNHVNFSVEECPPLLGRWVYLLTLRTFLKFVAKIVWRRIHLRPSYNYFRLHPRLYMTPPSKSTNSGDSNTF